MLTVHRSAATEPLADRLAEGLWAQPPADPFRPVEVAVQSRGMERWLSHQLAERLGEGGAGVCANVRFPFPGKVVATAATAALGEPADDDPWAPARLVFVILDTLPGLLRAPELAPVARYLRDAGTGVDRRTWALAREIADLFDRYALYRPRMVRAWSAGEVAGPRGDPLPPSQQWQATLWRALADRLPADDPATRLDRAITALRRGRPAEPGLLPERVILFGISALPPRHVHLLHALAGHVPVDLHVLTPSPSRWAPRPGAGGAAEHPLLESCARLAEDLGAVLDGIDHVDAPCPEPAPRPAPTRLLDVVQADLREDLDRGAPGTPTPSHRLEHGDASVQVHACHGPSRQVEVLRDVLLGLLADDPSLQPRDVLVMTPDVEAYAPLIGTVFADVGDDAPTLPVRVADRSLRGTNAVAEVLLDLCALADGRVTASAVLDLVGAAPVAARFRLTTEELTRLTGWVADSGIRWGVDERDRDAAGQPAERVHTWRFGLDRLLAGAAIADEDDRVVGDVVPFDDVEGQDVELLGRVADAVTAVFDLRRRLAAPRTVPEWAATLRDALELLVELDDADRWRVHEVRSALDDLAELPVPGAGEPRLGLGAVRSLLDQALAGGRGAAGYETGAVTVCAMVPMRSIPHRVVCLLGADDDAFPRVARRQGFDLLGDREEVGDRDRRDEDRFLFLEALIAARDHLVITYTGRDPRTNERRAPAVPVAELLDVLERSATVDAGKDAEDVAGPAGDVRDRLVTEHPLQPFSPRNFRAEGTAAGPRSFDASQLAAARALQAGRARPRPFLADRLPEPPEEEVAVVRVAELARFLTHPTRALLETRLGLRLREDVVLVSDAEPIDLEPLEQYGVGAALLEASLRGRDRDRWRDALLARGTVPAGALGRREVDQVAARVDAILAEASDLLASPPQEHVVDLDIGGHRLQGTIGGIHDGTRLVLQYANVRPKHELDLWIHHLALTAAGHAAVTSRLAGRDGGKARVVELGPLHGDGDAAAGAARDHLRRLLALRAEGLRRPLPLFESTSKAYAERAMKEDEHAHEAALRAARSAWEGQAFGGDRDDDYVVQTWGEEIELAALDAASDFAQLALAVYAPVIEHRSGA